MIKLRNTTDVEFILQGTLFREQGQPDNEHQIPEERRTYWANDPEVVGRIADGSAVLSLFDVEETNISKAIDALKGRLAQTVALETKDAANRPLVAVDKPSGEFETFVSLNYCDDADWPSDGQGGKESRFMVDPAAGKVLELVRAEVQFTHDVSIGPTELYFDYYAWHPSSPGVPVLAQRVKFTSIRDVFELGNEHYHCPALPEISGGLSTVMFNYPSALRLHDAEVPGALSHVELSTKNHDVVSGTYATVALVTREVS